MIDSAIEVTTNIFQGFMYIGFLFLFFNSKKFKLHSVIIPFVFAMILFLSINYFSKEIFYRYKVDSFVYIAIMEIYTILFCKGNLSIKIIMPCITYLVNTVLSYGVSYIISYLTGYSYIELATNSSSYRLLCIIVINLTNLFVYYIIVKIRSKKLMLNRWTDVLAFIIMPVIAMTIVYSTFQVLHLAGYKKELLIYLIAICLAVTVICIISWMMLERISKSYEINTQLLLIKQREKMYKNNTIQINDQIDKIAKIKHDMKNNLFCIDELLLERKYEKARSLCHSSIIKLNSTYIPLHTNNLYLNAIINVELEKALMNHIEMTIDITDDMIPYSESTDIISIIGNMCDNAIEYLLTTQSEKRQVKLLISRKVNYYIIVCKNNIDSSVITENPELETIKKDKNFHGRGIDIIKEKAEKHQGHINIYEEDGFFVITAFLSVKILPEN